MKSDGSESTLPLATNGALLDSGTSLMTLPSSDMNNLLRLLKKFVPTCEINRRVNQIVCTSRGKHEFPNLSVNLCGKEHLIKPDIYLEFYAKDGNVYIYLIKLSIVDLKSHNIMILGATFMKEYYSVFNQDKKTVGIVKAKHI